MQINKIKFKDLEIEGFDVDAESLKTLCILAIGIVAITALPSPSMKLKALTATMSALAIKQGVK